MSRKVLFLDRDGTLIINKHYLNNCEEIEYLPNVFSALSSLKNLGFEFVIVTNQSGIPRGLITAEQLEEIHSVVTADFKKHGIEFLKIYHAPHLPESNHPDRKPNPGMLLKAQREFNIDFSQSWMIGDSEADIGAGKNAHVPTIFIGKPDQIDTTHPDVLYFEDWAQIAAHLSSQYES